MENTLEITNNFAATIDGNPYQGKQGEIDSNFDDPFEITVTGPAHIIPGSLATATWQTVWDNDDDVPTSWSYLYIWTEVAMHIQLVGTTAMTASFQTLAKVPFVLSNGNLFAAANVTDLSAAPSAEVIDHIRLGNHSGGTGKFLVAVFS